MSLSRIAPATLAGLASAGSGNLSALSSADARTLDLLTKVLRRFTRGMDKISSGTLGFFGCGDPEGGLKALQGIARRMARLQQAFAGGGAPPIRTTGSTVRFAARVEQVSYEVSLENAEGTSGRFRMTLQRVQVQLGSQIRQGDPLVLDLGDDGIEVADHTRGVFFDLEGTGRKVQTAFVSGNDALLALDLNGNGRIDSGRELFGDQHGAANGFEQLARYDDNGDGRIDRRDAIFDKLLLWQNLDRGGAGRRYELTTLLDRGIRAIELDYDEVDEKAGPGGRIVQRGRFVREDGSTGLAADVLFNYVA